MPIKVELPHVGESVTEGIIGKWLKKPGDRVEKYDPIAEVVTDKVTMEIPSPATGRITALLVKEGDTVAMGAAIAEMDTEEAAPAKAASITPAVGRTGVLLKDVRPVGPTGSGEEPVLSNAEASPLPSQSPAPVTSSERSGLPAGDGEGGRQRYSPVVRRLAEDHQVDLGQVQGSGLSGRVTKEDVLHFVETRKGATQATASTPAPGTQPAPDEEVLPLTPMRRIIAENMLRSATQIPQAWGYVEADVSSLVVRREGAKQEFLRREGVDLTYLPFVIKAVVECLKERPLLNSTWAGERIILKKRMHIGIAVAAPHGLVVPVVHDADHLSISALAKTCRDLTARARENKLTLADVQGGTFTVNNTGALGSVLSQPLVNPPQAAILTTEAIVKRLVVLPGDAIAVRSIMNLCLSFDHRVMDGAEATGFLSSLKRRLEAIGPETPLY